MAGKRRAVPTGTSRAITAPVVSTIASFQSGVRFTDRLPKPAYDAYRLPLWITRKGAIRAGVDDYGLIPGAMGQASFVVRGSPRDRLPTDPEVVVLDWFADQRAASTIQTDPRFLDGLTPSFRNT